MNIPFSKVTISQEEQEAVSRVLKSGWLAAGPETEAFEKEFSNYITPGEYDKDGNKYIKDPYYCIFTNSCTSALKMAYNILKEIGFTGICYPKNTFVATYSAAAELGLDVYSYGGHDGSKGDICQNQSWSVRNVKPFLKTGITLIDENSVLSSVIEKVEKGCESPHRQNSKKEKAEANLQSLLKDTTLGIEEKKDNTQIQMEDLENLKINGTQILTIMQQYINGLKNTTKSLENVKNVELIKMFSGLIKTTSTQEIETTGNNYVQNVISGMTELARVNMSYGGVKDETPCVIEDSAHRIEPNDKLVGLMRCYSFYATKNLTTGSGGMFVTDNKEIYEIARRYWRDGISSSTYERQHGKSWDYSIKRLVSGYDGNDIGAAIGRVQLRRLPAFNKRRNEIRDRYNDSFGCNWQGNHLYPYFVSNESEVAELIRYLKEKGIGSGYHYPGNQWLGVSLPIYPLLTDDEQEYIIRRIKEWNTKKSESQ